MEYSYDTDGKAKLVSLGEQQIQQDGLKYEPDLVLRMVSPGNMDGTNPVVTVLKSRYAILRTGEDYEITTELLKQLREYLDEGVSPDVIIEEQRQELIKQVKEYCNTTTRKSVWKSLKESSGFTGKLEDMPMEILKPLLKKLIED